MVNMQPGGQGEQQWFPRLPEGYEGNPSQGMQGYGNEGWPPGMGMPGQGMQGYPQGQGFGMPGFSPGQGGQGFGGPGFSPGQGGQGFGGPGFPPGQGGQGFGGPGFPPGQGGQGFGRPGFPPGQGGPGFGGPGFPPGQGQQQGQRAPSSPPPNRIPEYPSTQLFAVDPGAIRGCLFRFTFVWTSRRQGFWFFPVFVGRTSVAGYRWRSRQRRWEYMGMDLNRIDRFSC